MGRLLFLFPEYDSSKTCASLNVGGLQTTDIAIVPFTPLPAMALYLQKCTETLWCCGLTHCTNCDIPSSHVIDLKVSDSPLLFLMSFLMSIKDSLKLFY